MKSARPSDEHCNMCVFFFRRMATRMRVTTLLLVCPRLLFFVSVADPLAGDCVHRS